MIIGVILLLIGLSLAVISVIEDSPVAVLVGGLALSIGIFLIFGKPTQQPKTIKCETIEQIDTLYRNGEIIGYEIKVK